MNEKNSLQIRQRSLLNDWLRASDGETRFRILEELRFVETELNEMMRRNHDTTTHIHQYALSK